MSPVGIDSRPVLEPAVAELSLWMNPVPGLLMADEGLGWLELAKMYIAVLRSVITMRCSSVMRSDWFWLRKRMTISIALNASLAEGPLVGVDALLC